MREFKYLPLKDYDRAAGVLWHYTNSAPRLKFAVCRKTATGHYEVSYYDYAVDPNGVRKAVLNYGSDKSARAAARLFVQGK